MYTYNIIGQKIIPQSQAVIMITCKVLLEKRINSYLGGNKGRLWRRQWTWAKFLGLVELQQTDDGMSGWHGRAEKWWQEMEQMSTCWV